jgi:hypothetical protein
VGGVLVIHSICRTVISKVKLRLRLRRTFLDINISPNWRLRMSLGARRSVVPISVPCSRSLYNL